MDQTEKLINENIEKIKKLSSHFNYTFHCHCNEKEFNTETFMKYLLKPELTKAEITHYLLKEIGYYYKAKYSETNLSTLIDDFIKHMRQFNNDAIGTANYIIAICVPGITLPSSGQKNAAIDNKLKEINDILFNQIPPNTNQELSNKLKEIERYGSELKKEYSEYYKEYRSLVRNFYEQREKMRDLVTTSIWNGYYDESSITNKVSRLQLTAHGYYDKILLKITEANNKLLDICKEFGVNIEDPDIFILSELKKLIDKCSRLSKGLDIYYQTALSRVKAKE
ncbi:MAG: hypothetical protein ACI4PJ_02425, partial [Acutalibacteraceae bacterium]